MSIISCQPLVWLKGIIVIEPVLSATMEVYRTPRGLSNLVFIAQAVCCHYSILWTWRYVMSILQRHYLKLLREAEKQLVYPPCDSDPFQKGNGVLPYPLLHASIKLYESLAGKQTNWSKHTSSVTNIMSPNTEVKTKPSDLLEKHDITTLFVLAERERGQASHFCNIMPTGEKQNGSFWEQLNQFLCCSLKRPICDQTK